MFVNDSMSVCRYLSLCLFVELLTTVDEEHQKCSLPRFCWISIFISFILGPRVNVFVMGFNVDVHDVMCSI